MSATTHDTVVKSASTFTTERKKGGAVAVDGSAAGDAAFEAVTNVREALQVCSDAVKAERVVTANSIGKATSNPA